MAADGDGFRFRAGRWCLDLCSTALWRHVEPVELLRQPADLGRWLLEAQLIDEPVEVNEAELESTRSLREAVYRLFVAHLAGDPLPAPDVATINEMAARPSRFPQLTAIGQAYLLDPRPVSGALAAVAAECIELLTGPLSDRLRECAASDCAFLFVDTSRPGRRRWCAQNRCGNRHHVREHRARAATREARTP